MRLYMRNIIALSKFNNKILQNVETLYLWWPRPHSKNTSIVQYQFYSIGLFILLVIIAAAPEMSDLDQIWSDDWELFLNSVLL